MRALQAKSAFVWQPLGPGATNLITGLGDAFADSVPLVAFTGQVAALLSVPMLSKEADVLGLSLVCTKHSWHCQSIEELPEIIASAFQIAQSGRPWSSSH